VTKLDNWEGMIALQ